jgi:hypothetical protein
MRARVRVGNPIMRMPPEKLKKASRAKARRIMVPGAERSMEIGVDDRDG